MKAITMWIPFTPSPKNITYSGEKEKPSIVIVIGLAKDQWDEISEILMKNYRRKRFIMWPLFCWLIEIHRYTFFPRNILQSHSRLLFLFYSVFFTMKKNKISFLRHEWLIRQRMPLMSASERIKAMNFFINTRQKTKNKQFIVELALT